MKVEGAAANSAAPETVFGWKTSAERRAKANVRYRKFLFYRQDHH
jgi:hypothetical protein